MDKLLKKILPAFLVVLLLAPLGTHAQTSDDITGHHHEQYLREMIEKGYMKGVWRGRL